MPKNPNNNSKSAKGEAPMTGAMKFFLAGLVAELYLLIVRRFYTGSNANVDQVLAWYDYLLYFAWAGLAIFVVGAVLAVLWRGSPKKREISWYCLGGGAFLGGASLAIRLLNVSALSLLTVLVPAAMLLSILWSLYDRECAYALTVLGCSLVALWVCRRSMGNLQLGTWVRVAIGVYIVLIALVAFLAHKADQSDGLLGKHRVLPADADALPIYVACGLSAVGMAAALISATMAYYSMWVLAIVAFALAVYYTVKQL